MAETVSEKWWKDKFKIPKGCIVKERVFEEGKPSKIIVCDKLQENWTSYIIENGELKKYKSGKSPLDVR